MNPTANPPPNPPTDPPQNEAIARVLAAVGHHLAAYQCGDILPPALAGAYVAAKAHDIAGESTTADALARAARAALPPMAPHVTRGSYANVVLAQALAYSSDTGRSWTKDDNQPAIPTIPTPRPAPTGGHQR